MPELKKIEKKIDNNSSFVSQSNDHVDPPIRFLDPLFDIEIFKKLKSGFTSCMFKFHKKLYSVVTSIKDRLTT